MTFTKPQGENFATIPKAAAGLGIKYYALLRAVNAGLVPSYKPFGNRRLLKPAEVLKYIERTREGGAI
ncbi:MAG: helix-turn-helix domain-containing protein [Verrucomicrobia bacterium]|nr:helix-turn-helix domain-containing protein [Verrucomicrobiota bacterium]